MEEVTKKIIEIEVQGEQTVKGLKEEIASLRDKLLNVKEGSEDYKNVLGQLIEDEKQLTSVMAAGKKEVHAAAGSYNALQQEMTSLKRVWKEVQDEASRNEIGNKINEINGKLKEMDASVGDFHRSVGDYKNSFVDASKVILGNLDQISPALGNIGGQINSLIPLITKTVQTATKGLTGIKAALVGTGIGALIVAVGLLVQNWDKFTEVLGKWLPFMRQSNEETKKQIEENNALLAVNKQVTDEMDFQARVMKAQGATTLEILAYKKAETEALLANTEAQIAETNAKIESLKAHSWLQRLFNGENKQIKQLEESLGGLIAEQTALSTSLKKLGQDIVIESITPLSGYTRETESAATATYKLADAMKALQEAERKAEAERQRRLKEQEELNKLSEELTKEYYDDLVEFDTTYIDTLIANRQREEELTKERQESYFKLAGSVQSVMGSIADAWENSVQAQLDAGEISEEEAERQFEQIKAVQTAEAIINTIAGAVGAFMGITKDTGGWGIAAAVAEAVAIMAAGMAQVSKIQSTNIGTKSVSNQIGNVAVATPQTEYTPNYTQNITNATETENLANAISQQPIWVSVKDIDKAQKRVTVVQNESTF